MPGALIYFGAIAVIIVGTWLLRRRSKTIDDYYDRDFQDPLNFDGLGRLGGGKMG